MLEKVELGVGVLGAFAVWSNEPALTVPATGFFLTDEGAFATCYHVLAQAVATNFLGHVVMTRDGRIFPMTSVLAANPASDLAVVQVDGKGFMPLTLAAEAPAGSAVWVVSHPNWYFYTLTTGIVSGYFRFSAANPSTWMSITADFAAGSSGAPVLNDCGTVVGVVSQSASFKSETDHSQQMMCRLCAPSGALLKLIVQQE